MESPGGKPLKAVFVGALVLCLAAVWFFARPASVPGEDGAPAGEARIAIAPPQGSPPPQPSRSAPPTTPSLPWPPAPQAPREEAITSDGIPIAPPRGEVTGPVHPHPITPQHQRIYAENRLVGALDGAMEVKDATGMRRLLDQYRREYPEDDNDLQDGYAVIADCLDHPGSASRGAAEHWLDAHNGSTLKRFVNRHCLDLE